MRRATRIVISSTTRVSTPVTIRASHSVPTSMPPRLCCQWLAWSIAASGRWPSMPDTVVSLSPRARSSRMMRGSAATVSARRPPPSCMRTMPPWPRGGTAARTIEPTPGWFQSVVS